MEGISDASGEGGGPANRRLGESAMIHCHPIFKQEHATGFQSHTLIPQILPIGTW